MQVYFSLQMYSFVDQPKLANIEIFCGIGTM